MIGYHLNTPKGTKDILLEECKTRRSIEKKLTEVFEGYGYSEVITPGLEFIDVFLTQGKLHGYEDMYKLIDEDGRILVLRSDSTAPIARLVSTRLKNSIMPVRLFYNQNVYLRQNSYSGRSSEIAQMGIELIGVNGTKSDLEALTLAVQAMRQASDLEFRLEIGHSGFVEMLMSELSLDEEAKEHIRSLIILKNYAALNDLLDQLPVNKSVDALRHLPRLFGGKEVFERAEAVLEHPSCRKILGDLKDIYEALVQIGLKESVLIDLGFVNTNQYYTGIIFQGYLHEAGEAVLSGGRYDHLLGQFGEARPAIGFGINLDLLTKKLLAKRMEEPFGKVDLLVFGLPGFEIQALQHAHQIRRGENRIVENGLFSTLDECIRYGKDKGITEIHEVGLEVRSIHIKHEEELA